MIREDFWSLDCKTVRIFASTILQFIWSPIHWTIFTVAT